MIAKVVVGTQFGPVVAYNFDQNRPGHGRATVLYSTLAAEDPARFAAEFDRVAARRPAVRRAVFHGSLRLVPGERAEPARLAIVARDFMAELGFTGAQYVVIQHASDHVHLIGNRVLPDGRIVPDGMIRLRANQVVTTLEDRYRLRPGTDLARRRRLDAQLEAAVADAMSRCDGTRTGLAAVLAEHGVHPTWYRQRKMVRGTAREVVVGVRYTLDEPAYSRRGSQLHECSWPRLRPRLLAREPEYRREQAAREAARREAARQEEVQRARERVAREEETRRAREQATWEVAWRERLRVATLAAEREQARLSQERREGERQARTDRASDEGSRQRKGLQGDERPSEETRGTTADRRPESPRPTRPLPGKPVPAAERARGTEPAPRPSIPSEDPPVPAPVVPTPPPPPVAPPATRPGAPPHRPLPPPRVSREGHSR